MKINFSFSKLLDNDKFVRLLAVFVAVIAWFVVSWTIDPTAEVTISNIPVIFDLEGTTAESYGLNVIEGDEQTVDIKVTGKIYKIGNLTADDFIATPKLSSVTKPGEYTLSVEVAKINLQETDYEVVPSYSLKVDAYFDYVSEISFDITARAENVTAEEGFVKEAVLSDTNKITLKGPQSELDKISKCVVETDSDIVINDMHVLEGELVFYDQDNNILELEHVTYQQQKFEITIQIYKHKVVPFTVSFINVPEGLDLSRLDYYLSEDAIEISGPKDTVDSINEISLGEIDFRKANIGAMFAQDVTLPAGVVNVNNTNLVTVTIDPTELAKIQLSVKNISPINLPAEYDVTVTTEVISNINIVGHEEDISNLSSNDLIARVDFQSVELSDGQQRVPVTIYATGNKFVWSVGEYTVLVNATKKQ